MGDTGTRKRRRRTYTTKDRDAAMATALGEGIPEAGRRHGIPSKTIWNWVRRAKSAQAKPQAAAPVRPEEAGALGESEIEGRDKGEPEAKDREVSPGEPAATPCRKPQRRYTPSEKAAILEFASKHGITAAARELNVSRFSVYSWRRQERRAAKGQGSSPTSGPAPQDVEAQRDQEILGEWQRHPGLGPSQIRNQLRRQGVKVAVNTVRRVMEEAGYRPPKVKSRPHDQRFEATRPNHMWHMDFVQRYINRTSVFTLILIDDYSRFVVGHAVDDRERADLVIEAFQAAVQRHGKPELVMHDKGGAFWSWRGISRFTALLTELGIDQIPAEHKEWNGKVEAFNGNLHTELFDVQRFYDVAEMKRRLATHLDWYNHRRTHHALGGLLVPADRFYGRSEEVLARVEAGLPGDEAHEGLDLRGRALELFKVTSQHGRPEVWLLGQRLLPPAG